MIKIFTPDSPYKKRARFAAILWTLLIFIACLTPGKEIPRVHLPFIDKWVHFVLFGVFAFLWLCAYPSRRFLLLLYVFAITALLGWFIELLQGMYPSLGRSKDIMDILADAVGGILGIVIFYVLASSTVKRSN